MKKILWISLVAVALILPVNLLAKEFHGLESKTLSPVTDGSGKWGLKIVFFNVGQADAILLVTPAGDACLIDSGKTSENGKLIASYLGSKKDNKVGDIQTIDLLYTTHYDLDHIGGLPTIVDRDICITKAFDQGCSLQRHGQKKYTAYITALGDPNDTLNMKKDEPDCVRHAIEYDYVEYLDEDKKVEIRCVAVRGDTKGNQKDLDLDPSNKPSEFNENPGCIALLIRLGEFEFYTAGDQTDDDWKKFPAAEEAVLDSGAIPGGNDIDLLKVSHHGSDTSTSRALVQKLAPEVVVISSAFVVKQNLPKRITLKNLQEEGCYVLITGDGTNDGEYCNSNQKEAPKAFTECKDFVPSASAVFNNQGNITVLISPDGNRYTVIGAKFNKTFSAKDEDNKH